MLVSYIHIADTNILYIYIYNQYIKYPYRSSFFPGHTSHGHGSVALSKVGQATARRGSGCWSRWRQWGLYPLGSAGAPFILSFFSLSSGMFHDFAMVFLQCNGTFSVMFHHVKEMVHGFSEFNGKTLEKTLETWWNMDIKKDFSAPGVSTKGWCSSAMGI